MISVGLRRTDEGALQRFSYRGFGVDGLFRALLLHLLIALRVFVLSLSRVALLLW